MYALNYHIKRRILKGRIDAKNSRDKKEKEAMEIMEKNEILRQEEEKFQEAKNAMLSDVDKYIELYPDAQLLKQHKEMEQRGELRDLKFHMHAIEELWDEIRGTLTD